jgi:hypothetical protein
MDVTVSASNTAPTANAGTDQANITPGSTVTLDGTGSTDSDGTVEAYSWRQISGSPVTLSSTTAAEPTFTAPTLTGGATLVFGLVVTDDDNADSTEDTVSITVLAESPVKDGARQITAIYDGDREIVRVYDGPTLIWEAS